MREIRQDILIETKLETIERLSSVKKPDWITEEVKEIHKKYSQLRESILISKSTWNYFEYCHKFAYHYYTVALLFYTYYHKHKINLDIIRIYVDKCISKLGGIRSSEREINETTELYTKVTGFKKAIDKIYIELENRLTADTPTHHQAKIMLNLGHVDYENFDFLALDLSSYHPHVLGVLLINFVADVEEKLTLHEEKDHYSKSNICRCLARVYQISGHQHLYEQYNKRASTQITLAFQTLGEEDRSPKVREMVRKIVKQQVVQFQKNLVEIYKDIKREHDTELTNLDCIYVETKFVKYCTQGVSTELHEVLVKMSKSKNIDIFINLLSNMENMKTLGDFQDSFIIGSFYKLLTDHKSIFKPDQLKALIKNFKKDIWNTISPKLREAQKELDVLKQLIIFLRSVTDCRTIIFQLQLNEFCAKVISVKTFITNILNLNIPDNNELYHLKSLTEEIKGQKTLLFMKKFTELLQGYAFPPNPTLDGNVMTLKGKLIIMSEVMTNILTKKTDAIKEVRILGADVVFINVNLENNQWAGINVLLAAKTVHVQGRPVWNVSGMNAANYPSKAEDGVNPGDDGKNGKHGLNGQSGGNVYILCNNMTNSTNFTIISNGGLGGSGQTGGDGAKGVDGKGIKLSQFENLIDPPHKISTAVKIYDVTWSKFEMCVKLWNNDSSYFTGRTEDTCNITYSYYPGWIFAKQEVLALYEGTLSEIGGLGGTGGLPGPGGFPGEVTIKCGHPDEVSIENKPGENGKEDSKNGETGQPGRNGWDMGFAFVNGWFKSNKNTIGRNQDCKLTLKYHDCRKESDFVYCPYKKKYIEIISRSSKINEFDRKKYEQQKQKEQEQMKATRAKAISRSVISKEEENISNDIVDELVNLALGLEDLKEQALEEIVEKDEEKETEMSNFQVQRQAVFDDSALQNERKVLRKRQKYIQQETPNVLVNDIVKNPTNIKLWLQLKSVVVDKPEDLTKLFNMLFKHKSLFRNHFTNIYNNLLNKYKIITCQKIEQTKTLPGIEVIFDPQPIGNYLIVECNSREYINDDLGILQEYFFKPNKKELLLDLQNYLSNIDVGQIIYPLKFFIMEKSYHDPEFKNSSEIVLQRLNNLETRLERLIKCYIVAYEKDNTSSMLHAIQKRKNEIINKFKDETDYEFIRKEFMEYVVKVGVFSTAVRELLSCAFNVNIKILILNENKQLIIYHNHNPTAENTLYLFLVNGQYVECRLDDAFINLITERKKLSKNNSDILNYVNNFVCKKDYDEFFTNFEQFKEFEFKNTGYLAYKKLSQDEVIDKICTYFPPNELNTIRPILSMLRSNIIENENILLSLLQRFDIEGLNISTYELVFIANTILRSFTNQTTNLEMFEWILSVKFQSKWLNEIFFIELENYFKKSLKSTSILRYIRTVKQKDILLLMDIKLREATDTINLKCIATCLEVLSEIEIDEETIRSLPLSSWQYTLREQLLEYRLCCIAKWDSNDQLQKALYYLHCIENSIGIEEVNKLLGVLDVQKNEITAQICTDILSLLHIEEWRLDDELLNKLATYGAETIQKELKQVQRNMNEERSLNKLLTLIENNSNTSLKVKHALQSLQQHPFLTSKSIEQPYYTETKIKDWCKQFKENIKCLNEKDKKLFIKEHTNEILTMILHAVKLKKGFSLRITQRLAILLMLNCNHNTLSQISTGEGKSLIVVAVSIFKAVCGEKVDIITSSSVLAKRDATVHKDIYDLFNVSVSHNCSERLDERRDAYSACLVMFGNLSNFQRDYLLDRFYGINILGDRTFDTLIVDEVDSMLLDKGNNTLYLSHEIPGLDKLESVYLFLWKRICMSAGRKIDHFEDNLKREVLFDLYGTLSIEDLQSYLNVSKQDANEIHNFLKDIKVLDQKHRVLKNVCNKDSSKLSNKYQSKMYKIQYIIKKILKRNTEIRIPKSLYRFVENHIDVWIKNGLLAIAMEEGIDYVVDVDRTQTKTDINPNITIIDKDTGTDQSNSQWEEALHQFLQLKHGCKVSPQSLKAVFISNVSYFRKYTKLFGLTGTLGSQVERNLLEELYDVQFVNVPTAKPKRFIEQEPLLCCTETDWTFRIVHRTTELTKANRSVLIICETIKEVNILTTAFQRSNISDKKIYKREYEECLLAQGKEELDGGSIIIATNLAGRGTDIKITDKLNKNGGLHVLLTYLPSNARIVQQAFGRAARSGCNGSGQLITIGYGSFLSKREQTEAQEQQRIAEIKIFFNTRIKVEENFFEEFTKIYKYCNNSMFVENKLKEISCRRLLDRWAFWIDEYGSKLSDDKTIDKVFGEFKKNMKDSFSKWNKWTEDPIQLVKVGLNFIKQKSYSNAIKVFDTVIKSEPRFSEAAHYYKAAALGLTLDFETQPFSEKNQENYYQFIDELKYAERLFEAHKDACIESSAFIQNLKQNMRNSFMTIDAYRNQQETMIHLYDLYLRSINDIIGHQVNKSIFRSQEINQEKSEQIYQKFLDKSVLKHSHIVKANFDDIEELCTSFGITTEALSSFLKAYEGINIEEQPFLKDLKKKIKIPSLEECWETLISEKKLVNEVEFVVIVKSKLTSVQEDTLKKVKQVQVNLKTNEGKHVLMKQYIHSDTEYPLIFEENLLKSSIDSNLYNTLKKENILMFNKTAELCQKNLQKPISRYDSISVNNLTSDDIIQSEAENILNILTEKGFLTKNTTSYSLVNKYDESKLPKIAPYGPALLQILRLHFAYRIAILNMQYELESNTQEQVFVKMIAEPHVSLMWELIGKKIIQPVSVNKHSAKLIDGIMKSYGKNETNYVKGVLKKLVGKLKSLETPAFKLVNIVECMNDLQVSPLQELNSFITNSLDFIIKTEEKQYTWKMIFSTFFVTILGLLEVVAGLAIQLFFAGTLSFLGNFLINEGLSDLQYAASCWLTGYFDWNDYGRHKLQSMVQSFVLTVISFGCCVDLRYSKFGSKLAMKGIIGQSGREIATLTGRQLISEVGGEAIAKEFSKQFIVKVGEGLGKGLINEGIASLLDSYLQNLCNQLATNLLKYIETAVNNHNIQQTLCECYRVLGPKQSNERIDYFTEKSLSCPSINSYIIAKVLEITSSISTIVAEIAKQDNQLKTVQYLNYLAKVLNYSQYATHLYDIVASVNSMLDKVNNELKKDIRTAEQQGVRRQQQYNEQDIVDFKNKIISKWRTTLQENANNIFTERIAKPVLQNCSLYLAKKSKDSMKKLNNYSKNKYHKHVFETSKKKKETDLQTQSLSEESKKQIIETYHETLIELKSNVRDPNLYAEIVMEKGHMDAVSLRATSSVLDRLRGNDTRLIKLTVVTDSGTTLEYCTPGIGETREINLKITNNHHTNSDYECVYRTLAHELPELNNQMNIDEFRREISHEIRSNDEIKHDIKHGKHAFTLKRRQYSCHRDEYIQINKLRKNLIQEKYLFSQSSEFTASHVTSSPMHLSNLADNMADNFDEIKLEAGRNICLENKRVVAASTIKNPDVKVLVRAFKYNEVLAAEQCTAAANGIRSVSQKRTNQFYYRLRNCRYNIHKRARSSDRES